jgi:two-component system nitrogen regulation sensor histidine kinase NtrY
VEYLDTLARNYDRLAPGPERQTCDVNAIVEQVAGNIARDGSSLSLRLSPNLPPAQGDTLMVRRITENLVGNALDAVAGNAEGGVTITTDWLGEDNSAGRVRLTIADTGHGMTQAELDRAFEDFYTTKQGGSGLGLSIVRRLILDLNGSLRFETEPGRGTRALVELPAASSGAVGK